MQRGFSLIELSIVLVILGLLTGGILAGKSLIRAAELRSVSTEYQRHITAVRSFRDKYFGIPGDITNATQFWGSAGGATNDAACQTASSVSSPATCNGDGDGTMSNANGLVEFSGFWKQLSNAGLVEGNYSGGSTQLVGVTVPAARMGNGNYFLPRIGNIINGSTIFFNGDYGRNTFRFRNATITSGSAPLTPEELWNIDGKMDDGLPGSGIVMAYKGDGSTMFCTTAAGVAYPGDIGATYKLDNPNRDCYFDMPRQF